ncbi:MAG: DUF418 domain-containing protein [bacterium]|nr:DUF418 domain-containing protein [bacterium]
MTDSPEPDAPPNDTPPKDAGPPVNAAPVVAADRIRSIDVLRGFALLGVLAMNMQAFAEVFAVYMNPYALGDISNFEFGIWTVHRVLADQKFMTIFSMLFGAGIVLMTERAKARTGKAAGLHYRRMLWLALFGFGHATLLWTGDILFFYGMVGMVAFLLRRVWLWLQVVLALLAFALPAVVFSFLDQMPPEELADLAEMWSPSADYIASTRETMRGPWFDQVAFRLGEWSGMLGFLVLFGWRIFANMLLGMVLFRTGVFAAQRSARFYGTLIVAGFVIGLPLCAYGVYDHVACDWDLVRSMGVGSLFNYTGSLFVAFGWIGLVMLICRRGALPGLRERFAAVGQMAFTNYILHSVISTTIYNGHGFGLFGQVSRAWQVVIVLAIFGLQLWYSPIWLRRFRFGPLEWCWRALAYWQLPPMRRS